MHRPRPQSHLLYYVQTSARQATTSRYCSSRTRTVPVYQVGTLIVGMCACNSDVIDNVNMTGNGLGPMTSLSNGSLVQLTCPACASNFRRQITMLPTPHCECVPSEFEDISL